MIIIIINFNSNNNSWKDPSKKAMVSRTKFYEEMSSLLIHRR